MVGSDFTPPPFRFPLQNRGSIPDRELDFAQNCRYRDRGSSRDRSTSIRLRSPRENVRPQAARPRHLPDRCANCDQCGHAVRDCVSPREHGFVLGCPLCNEKHGWESCRRRRKDRDEDYQVLVVDRINRPPVVCANLSWFLIWVQRGHPSLPGLPWSLEFSQRVHRRETGFDPSTFDYSLSQIQIEAMLPRDPATENARHPTFYLTPQVYRRRSLNARERRSASPENVPTAPNAGQSGPHLAGHPSLSNPGPAPPSDPQSPVGEEAQENLGLGNVADQRPPSNDFGLGVAVVSDESRDQSSSAPQRSAEDATQLGDEQGPNYERRLASLRLIAPDARIGPLRNTYNPRQRTCSVECQPPQSPRHI